MNLEGLVLSACSAVISVIIFAVLVCIDAISESDKGISKGTWVVIFFFEGLLALALGRFFVAGIGLILIACGLAMSIFMLRRGQYSDSFMIGGISAIFVGLLLVAVPAMTGYLVVVPGMF